MYVRSFVAGCALLAFSYTAAFSQARDFQAERLIVDDNNGNKITLQTPTGPITGGTLTIPDPAGPSAFLIANPPGGSQTVWGAFLPGLDSAYDLGSSSLQWRDLFLKGSLNAGTLNIGFTNGSVVFTGPTGNLAQNNANFFWDNTNNRLGIGNNAPAVALDVTGNIHATGTVQSGNSIIIDGTTATRTITSDAAMTVQTTAGNITINSTGGTTTVDDALNVNGTVTAVGGTSNVVAGGDVTSGDDVLVGDDIQLTGAGSAIFNSNAIPVLINDLQGLQVSAGPIDGQAAANQLGDGTNAEQLQINGVNGGAVEFDLNGDADISGAVTVGGDVTADDLISNDDVIVGDDVHLSAAGSVIDNTSGTTVTVDDNLTANGTITAAGAGNDLAATDDVNVGDDIHLGAAGSVIDNTSGGTVTVDDALNVNGTITAVGAASDVAAGGDVTSGDDVIVGDDIELAGAGSAIFNSNAIPVLINDLQGLQVSAGPINGQAAANQLGDGTNAEQLQINGVNGGAVEVDINGDADISGTLTAGSFGLGVANANRVAVTNASGAITTDAEFAYNTTTNALDIQGAIANSLGSLNLNDNTLITGNLVLTGASDLRGAVSNSTGNLALNDAVDVTGNVVPTADNTYALGSDANRWAEAYVAGTSVHIGPTGGEAGNTELNLGYAAGAGTVNVNGGLAEISVSPTVTTINGSTNAAATTIGNSTNGLDINLETNSGTNVLINSSTNAGGVQIGDGVTTGGISIASGAVLQLESGPGNAVAINTTVAGVSTTTIGRSLATSTTNLNSPVINMVNLPTGSATDNLVTTDGTQIFETTVATLLGGSAWLIGGNTLTGTGSIGSNSDHALDIETNGTTRMTIANSAGGGNVNILTNLDVDGTVNMDGAFDANAAGNVIGDGTNAEQLEVDGVDGGAVEVDVNGDMDISGTLSVGQVVMGGKLDMNQFGIVNVENIEFNTVASQLSNLVGDVTVADNLIINSGGTTDLTITEDGFDRSSATTETFQVNNSGAGAATLVVNGGAAPTNSRLTIDDGHWTSQQTTAPVAAVAGANVTSATLSNQTDVAGFIDITSSATPAVGAQASVTFNTAYGTAPIVVMMAANGPAAGVGAYVTRTTTGFTVNFIGLPAASTSYQFYYQVIETQ